MVRRFGRSAAAFVLIYGLCLIWASVGPTTLGNNDPIAQGDQAYNQRFSIPADQPMEFLRAYRPHMERAIGYYETAIRDPGSLSVQSQAHVYNRLAQLNYELAKVLILEEAEEKVITDLLAEGKEYGFKSLQLHPGFDREKFLDTLTWVRDAAALVWTADCWGTWLGYNPLEGVVNLSKVRKMYEQAIALDEWFWSGSGHIGLGALLATTPSMMGGDLEEAKEHFERALEIDPDYLPASVVYAESYGFTHSFGKRSGIRDRRLIEERLTFVANAPVGEKRPLWNWEAKAEAETLWRELDRFSH
ncbi:MAG: TRAP transporter TatT component family protein [Candidatus Bipolaricaulia bacterium]